MNSKLQWQSCSGVQHLCVHRHKEINTDTLMSTKWKNVPAQLRLKQPQSSWWWLIISGQLTMIGGGCKVWDQTGITQLSWGNTVTCCPTVDVLELKGQSTCGFASWYCQTLKKNLLIRKNKKLLSVNDLMISKYCICLRLKQMIQTRALWKLPAHSAWSRRKPVFIIMLLFKHNICDIHSNRQTQLQLCAFIYNRNKW